MRAITFNHTNYSCRRQTFFVDANEKATYLCLVSGHGCCQVVDKTRTQSPLDKLTQLVILKTIDMVRKVGTINILA